MIEVRRVSKSFKGVKALNDVSFTIDRGEFVLLLGPNGSGKTTLLRCMVGLLSFQGEILIDGMDVRGESRRVRRIVGYLPQNLSLYNDMTCYQVLDFFSNLRGVDIVLEDVLEPLGLMDKADTKIGELSGGMRQKLGLTIALLGDPEILLLDEPFNNMDAEGRAEAIKLLLNLRERGKTIIVSTHTISGLLPISDRIIIMEGGKVISHSTSRELLKILNLSYKVHILANGSINVSEGIVTRHPTGWITVSTNNLLKTLDEIIGSVDGRIIVEEPDVDELIMRIKREI